MWLPFLLYVIGAYNHLFSMIGQYQVTKNLFSIHELATEVSTAWLTLILFKLINTWGVKSQARIFASPPLPLPPLGVILQKFRKSTQNGLKRREIEKNAPLVTLHPKKTFFFPNFFLKPNLERAYLTAA